MYKQVIQFSAIILQKALQICLHAMRLFKRETLLVAPIIQFSCSFVIQYAADEKSYYGCSA